MDIVIVGNGAIGMMTAFEILQNDNKARVTIIGKSHRPGSASLAAAAMFNSFCEIDKYTLSNEFEKKKFEFNKQATQYWPDTIAQIESRSKQKLCHGFGTVLVNNHCSDKLEDENFDAIVQGLEHYKEPYETIAPSSIKNYDPEARARASRAILIHGEGWINPLHLMSGLEKAIRSFDKVQFVDSECVKLVATNGRLTSAETDSNESIKGDFFVVCPGATYSKLMQQSQLGLKTPQVFYGVGCSLLLKTGEHTMRQCVRTPNRGLACGVYSAPQDPDFSHTVVGASNFISKVPEQGGRLTSLHTLIDASIKQLNRMFYKAELVKVNTGWRPTSEDTVPLLGTTSLSNMFVATGTKRDGLHCSPLIAKCIQASISGKDTPHDISFFKPERDLYRIYKRDQAINILVDNVLNAAYQHGFTPSMDRMVDDLRAYHRSEFEKVHDQVGAKDWGIPPEMINMYKYGHAR